MKIKVAIMKKISTQISFKLHPNKSNRKAILFGFLPNGFLMIEFTVTSPNN